MPSQSPDLDLRVEVALLGDWRLVSRSHVSNERMREGALTSRGRPSQFSFLVISSTLVDDHGDGVLAPSAVQGQLGQSSKSRSRRRLTS